MEEKYLNTCLIYDDYHGPVEHAEWENFISGSPEDKPVMYALTLDDACVLVCRYIKEFLNLDYPVLHADYANMDAVHIDHLLSWIRKELDHWEAILSSFENLGSDILRFLVIKEIPIQSIMRFILASRNIDRDGNTCSFDEAQVAWNVQ